MSQKIYKSYFTEIAPEGEILRQAVKLLSNLRFSIILQITFRSVSNTLLIRKYASNYTEVVMGLAKTNDKSPTNLK